MFTKQKVVLAITKQSVQICTIVLEHPPRKLQTKTYPLAGRKLIDILTPLAPLLKNDEILVLMSDDLSYTLSCTLPLAIDPKNERSTVSEIIKTEIPEILENDEWDFKEIKSTGKGREVVVFAPVKKFFHELSEAATKLQLNIAAIEPASIAIARHEDPILGIALKQDYRGKDEQTLNVIPTVATRTQEQSPLTNSPGESTNQSAKVQTDRKKIGIILATILLVISIGTGIFFFIRSKNTPEIPPGEISEATPVPETPTVTAPPPIPTAITYKTITIQVLNGSGEEGASSAVKEKIEGLGFKSIDVGNADSYTYTKTEIRKKESVPDQVIDDISDKLTGYSTIISNPLTNDFDYDVLITVGEKN